MFLDDDEHEAFVGFLGRARSPDATSASRIRKYSSSSSSGQVSPQPLSSSMLPIDNPSYGTSSGIAPEIRS